MQLYFLGTGAADYGARLKTDLADRFDRDIRRSNALLVDGHLLIDCGDWILNSIAVSGIDPTGIRQVLVSHSHHDHFRPEHLCSIAAQAGHPIDVYANADILRILDEGKQGLPGAAYLKEHLLMAEPRPTEVEFEGIRVTPLRSNHQTDYPGEQTMHFLLEKDGKSLFYGTDGAWLPTATGKYLFGRHLTAYLFDATCGDYTSEYRIFEHNTLPMIRLMKQVLTEQGAFDENTKVILIHIAPSLHKSHAETEALAARDGMLVSYDGMELTI